MESVVGYGTFITRLYWKDKENVEVCLIKDYVRIFPKGSWFPYVLNLKDSTFWALKFEVDLDQLNALDLYEGVPKGLFKRKLIQVVLKNGILKDAFIYIPTERTIKTENLSPESDTEDRWKEKIYEIPELVANFPELVQA